MPSRLRTLSVFGDHFSLRSIVALSGKFNQYSHVRARTRGTNELEILALLGFLSRQDLLRTREIRTMWKMQAG